VLLHIWGEAKTCQQRAAAKLSALPDKGDPNGVITPVIEGTPVPVSEHEVALPDVDAVLPDVERGVDGLELGSTTRGVSVISGANGFGASATDGGLSPPTAISVEPMGIPTLPTDETEPAAVGDDAIADPGSPALALGVQPPEADPDMPPPSNKLEPSAVEPPVFMELPDVEVPIPGSVCEAEPSEQVAMPPTSGNVPDIVGLTPGDASSVAPMGILIGGTGEPGPTPSGEVMPNVGPGNTLIPPTCAETEPQPKRTAAVVATTWRVIMGPTLFEQEFAMRPPLHCAARHRANAAGPIPEQRCELWSEHSALIRRFPSGLETQAVTSAR
jgi:hypothetical protein